MTKIEKEVMMKLLKDNKSMKEQLDYLVDAVELLVAIQTEQIKNKR